MWVRFYHPHSYIPIMNKISWKSLINLIGIKKEHWGKQKQIEILKTLSL